MGRNIDIFNDVDGLMFEYQDICHLFECLDTTEYGIVPGDLSIVFLNKISMKDIHEQYLQDDTLTDVITLMVMKICHLLVRFVSVQIML